MSHRLSRQNNRGQQEQDYRYSAVKAAEFRFDPRIQVTLSERGLRLNQYNCSSARTGYMPLPEPDSEYAAHDVSFGEVIVGLRDTPMHPDRGNK